MDEAPEESGWTVAAALAEVGSVLVRNLSRRQGMSLTTSATLTRLERESPIRLTALAMAEGVAQPSMTALVQRLERQGLASRMADPDDGRACLVVITQAGREHLADSRRDVQARLAGLLAGLPEPELRALGDALRTALPIVRRIAHDTADNHHDWSPVRRS
jgi:DNA-binding MarR family transcriptional regulator